MLKKTAEKEEGIFLEGGKPNRVGPMEREISLYKRRARQPLFLMLMIIDFMSA